MAAESTVRILFLGDSAQAVRSVQKLEGSMSGLGKTTKLLAGAMGVLLVGGLVEATKQAAEFQSQMELVHTQAGASTKEVEKMSKALLKLAPAVGSTPNDLAKGLFHVESAGFRGAKALGILEAAAKGAAIGHASLEDTVNSLVGAIKVGEKGAGGFDHTMSILNATIGAGNMRLSDLNSALATGLLSAAKSVGIPIQDVGAALGELTDQGQGAAASATRLQMAFLTMAANTKKGIDTLHGIGITQNQLAQDMRTHGLIFALQDLQDHLKSSGKTAIEQQQIIADVFGRRSLKAILPLLQRLDDVTAKQKQITSQTKNYGEAWKATQQTVDFQLAKAKSSLEAAAIPIGNLILPLLVKAADAANRFATGIEHHMPQIRADFEQLGGVLHMVGQALGQLGEFALSPVGQSTLLGLLAGAGAAKAIGSLSSLAIKAGEASSAFTGLGVAGLAAEGMAGSLAIGVGILAGAVYLLASSGSNADLQVRHLSEDLNTLSGATEQAGQSSRNLARAHIAQKMTALEVKDAQKAYTKALAEHGPKSEATYKAELALAEAKVNHRQATADLASATKVNTATQKSEKDQIEKVKQQYEETIHSFQKPLKVGDNSGRVKDFADKMGSVAAQARAAARAIPDSDKAAKRAATNLALAAQAAHDLAKELGRVASQKEINVRVNIMREIQNITGPTRGPLGRAGGGFIPATAGSSPNSDSVPAMLTPGEVVLNRSQQNMLGGPQAIASMFGFTGSAGPGFAQGGIVSADGISQRESDLDRSYGQMQRQFQIEDHGGDYTPWQVKKLLASRVRMLGLMAAERRAIKRQLATEKDPGKRQDLRMSLHQLPGNIRDVQLDIMELKSNRAAARAAEGPSVSDLEAEISRLRLGQSLQMAQSSIIGAFAKGTLHVPETGVALVHAGESITPAGQGRATSGDGVRDVVVNLRLEGPLAPLAEFVKATVDTPQMADRISVRIGQSATVRARSGRY